LLCEELLLQQQLLLPLWKEEHWETSTSLRLHACFPNTSKPEKTFKKELGEALEYLDFPEGAYLSVDASVIGTYIQMNANASVFASILQLANLSLDTLAPNLLPKYDSTAMAKMPLGSVARQALQEKARWYMVLVGEQQAGMFGHQDVLPVGSWQLQVQGRKRWQVCRQPPNQAVTGTKENEEEEDNTSRDSVCSADDNACTQVAAAAEAAGEEEEEEEVEECWETTLLPGDLVYYPPSFWHETQCLDSPTISVSGSLELGALEGFVRSQCVIPALSGAPPQQLQQPQRKFSFGEEVCAHFIYL
jgi:hypothetical protein